MKSVIFGTWCEIPSALSVNAISKSGLDFLLIDLEHGGINFESVQSMVLSAQVEGTKVFVRVSEKNPGDISPVLDMGIDGVMIPHVQTKNDIKNIIDHCFFAPIGNRGFNPFTRSCGYKSVNQNCLNSLNEKLLLSVIIEDKMGLQNIDEIASNEHVDIIYLGQYDLSVSLGIPGEMDNPLILKILSDAVKIINTHNKSAGCMVHSIEAAKEAIKNGYKFIMYSVDTNILYNMYDRFMKGVTAL
jgi:4-hydroxy-2-oxoheptanedioate aldolase